VTRPLFFPSPRAIVILTVLGAAALACSFTMRYGAIQNTELGLACQASSGGAFCTLRRLTISLYEYSIFGVIALGAALINLLRPSVSLFALALVATGLGIVLYNVALSGIAVALLILSFARPAATTE
jgi:hypothetical protein